MHKSPKYVQVYNQIMQMIKRSQFAPGSKLPSEEILADEFEVSRVTLRTALSLLKEDGVIKSIHGQGHFVNTTEAENSNQGIEVLGFPLLKSITVPVESRDTYYHENDGSVFTDKLFNVAGKPYLTLNIWYQNNDQNIANCLSILLPETANRFGIDLEDGNQIIQFIEKDIYRIASNSKLTISVSERLPQTFRRDFLNNDPLILITEDIYAVNGSVLMQNKYYIPATVFKTSLICYQDDYSSRNNINH